MASDASPRRRSATRRTNLVDSPSSFIGRAADAAAIAARFDEGARIVTIVGAGGIGKTRVAVHVGERHVENYSSHGGGGVWFCDVTYARSATAACAVVGDVLGIPLSQTENEREVIVELGRAMARLKRVLIIVDNVEHIAAEAAVAIAEWVRRSPQARFLVTSRVPLGTLGEHLWPLRAMALPRDGVAEPAELLRTEAVELFVRRAREVRPDALDDPADLLAIAEIVRRLDGLPLAIELAAARAFVLSPAQILARLDAPLGLLVRRGDEGRHASMRRAILDSYRLLDTNVRECFSGCAIFRGGFTIETADAVLGNPGHPALPELEALAAHSLVRTWTTADGGQRRFAMYETIRAFAYERLRERPELRACLVERHCAHFAETADARLLDSTVAAEDIQGARLAADFENFVLAHTRAVESAATQPRGPGAERALAIALALDPLLATRGLFRLRLRLLNGAIECARAAAFPDRSADLVRLAEALVARGHARRELGAFGEALVDLHEGLALAQRGEATMPAALAEARIGELVETAGDTVEARQHFARALAHIRNASHEPLARVREAEVRARLGHARRREGELQEAETETRLAIEL